MKLITNSHMEQTGLSCRNHQRTAKAFLACAILTLALFAAPGLMAHAASATLSPSTDSVSVGNTVTFTVNVSDADSATSAAVDVSCSSEFELVSGEWLKSGVMSDFNISTRRGALAFSSAGSMNGALFRVTLRAKSYVASAQSASVHVQIKNGTSMICEQTVSASASITCASHSYGGWAAVSSATCTTAGKEQRSCTVCGVIETRDISALGHKFDKLSETKAPTCTAAGEKAGTCKTCGQKVTEAIPAAGHTFGDWKEVTAPSFSTPGTAKRICSKCNAEETREIAALGYEFTKPSSSRESVFVYYDISGIIEQNALSEKGYINAKFAVPSGSGSEVHLYYVTESGGLEEISATLSEDGNLLEATLTKSGTYAICKLLDKESDVSIDEIPDQKADHTDNNTTAEDKTVRIGGVKSELVWIAIASIEFLAIVGYGGYRFRKKISNDAS